MILPLAFLFLGCEKDNSARCEGLKVAVQNDDIATVRYIVNRLAADIKMQASTTIADPEGYHNSYLMLIDRLNDECDMKALGVCYACIDTLPATSEIKLIIFTGSRTMTRIIDVRVDREGTLVCTNMHE